MIISLFIESDTASVWETDMVSNRVNPEVRTSSAQGKTRRYNWVDNGKFIG